MASPTRLVDVAIAYRDAAPYIPKHDLINGGGRPPSPSDARSPRSKPVPVIREEVEKPLDYDTMLAFIQRIVGKDTSGYLKIAYAHPDDPDRRVRHSNCNLSNPRRWDVATRQLYKHAPEHNLFVAIAIYRTATWWEWSWITGKRRYFYRTKEMIRTCRWVIADLDRHSLSPYLPPPTVLIETSAGSLQAWWELVEPVDADICGSVNRWIAASCGMGNEAVGATTILRVPGSRNRKRYRQGEIVRIIAERDATYTIEDFTHLRPAEESQVHALPDDAVPTKTATTILDRIEAPICTHTMRESGLDVDVNLKDKDGDAIWAAVASHLNDRWLACAEGEPITRSNGEPYKSESNRDQALLSALARIVSDDNDLAAAFLATPRGQALIARKGAQDIIWRLNRMIHKARILVRPHHPPTGAATFITLDGAVLAHASILGPGGVAVAVVMASYAPNIYPSQKTIGARLGKSIDFIGDQQTKLREMHLFEIVRHRKQQPVYTMMQTSGQSVRLPRDITRTGLSMDAVAAYAIIAGRSTTNEPLPSQQEVADALNVPRQRINPAVRELEHEQRVEASVGARGRKTYRPACAIYASCPK